MVRALFIYLLFGLGSVCGETFLYSFILDVKNITEEIQVFFSPTVLQILVKFYIPKVERSVRRSIGGTVIASVGASVAASVGGNLGASMGKISINH